MSSKETTQTIKLDDWCVTRSIPDDKGTMQRSRFFDFNNDLVVKFPRTITIVSIYSTHHVHNITRFPSLVDS